MVELGGSPVSELPLVAGPVGSLAPEVLSALLVAPWDSIPVSLGRGLVAVPGPPVVPPPLSAPVSTPGRKPSSLHAASPTQTTAAAIVFENPVQFMSRS